MRFLIGPNFHDELKQAHSPSPDCFVRSNEYLHHLYVDGVKYVVLDALTECLEKANIAGDQDALRHLELHQSHLEALGGEAAIAAARADGADLIGDPPPPHLDDEEEEDNADVKSKGTG